MKTIQNTKSNEIVRTTNNNATMLTKTGQWVYIPKQEWKKQVRDIPPDKQDQE